MYKWGGYRVNKNTLILVELIQGNVMRAFHFKNTIRLSFVEKIFGMIYFVYLFFRPIFLKLDEMDKYRLSKIQDSSQIINPNYKKLPLDIAKQKIRIHQLINRNKSFYANFNSFKTWFKVYKINKKFRNIIIEDELFL